MEILSSARTYQNCWEESRNSRNSIRDLTYLSTILNYKSNRNKYINKYLEPYLLSTGDISNFETVKCVSSTWNSLIRPRPRLLTSIIAISDSLS